MDQKPINPLSKHFRQPAIYAKLPSMGRFWPEGSLDLPVTGEIPVYPMTARDEITLRTPDALLNGQGVVDVIQSCCPNIKDAWKMPSIDVDAVLLNIRIASYGASMDFDTKCPKCAEENSFTVDIGSLISQINMPNYDTPIEVGGLKITLAPQAYFEVNKTNQLTFTEQQIIRTINDDTLSEEEKKQKSDQFLSKLIDLNVNICTSSTREIATEDGTVVTDKEFIREFYNAADYKVMRVVQKTLEEISSQIAIKPLNAQCTSCEQAYDVPMTFDYSNFFA